MNRRRCMYCNAEVRAVRKGEHIIPESLGGALSIRNVCSQCNNEFSVIDKELVSKTPLGIVAGQELGASTDGLWDYNAEHDLALEARIVKELDAPVLWPQVVFDDRGPMFWFDLAEGRQVGEERCMREFLELVTRARNTLRGGYKRPRWLWTPVTHPPRRGRFPPRVFTPHSYRQWSNRVHFICRYLKPIDQNRILWSLDNWRPFEGRVKLKECWGSIDPEAQISYRPRYILRALVKIGINSLAHICKQTRVDQQAFPEAIQFVRYDRGDGPSFDDCGFVRNEDVQTLDCPNDAHALRLTHGANWGLDCAFFGGRIGATVSFPGPNHDKWQRAEIVAPIGRRDWQVRTSRVVLPRTMRVEWGDICRIAPSLPVKNVEHRFRLERRPGN